MGFRSAFSDLRNRLVAKPGFRRWAKAFPLTRGQARKNARALFDLMAGFVYFQTLYTCFSIKLFDFLKDGPQSVEAIAEQAGLPVSGADRLARAAASLKLLEPRDDGQYALGALGAALVDEPGLAAMAQHHQLLYQDLVDPHAVLRGEAAGHLAGFWGYGTDEAKAGRPEDYSELMAATLPMVAEEVFAACDFRNRKRLLDVGGGQGAFVTEAARHAPHLEFGLFDLPPVAARARERLAEAGLAKRVEVHGGSFLSDPLPAGYDLISLVRIAHDHSDEDVMRLLKACRQAITPDGVLLIAEPMAEADGAAPMGEAYFGFYLMAMGGGRPRSSARLSEMLAQAGFGSIRIYRSRMPLITDVLTARPQN